MPDKSYTVDVQQNDDGESFIEFPDEVMSNLGWEEGDTVVWKDNHDGSYTISKRETEWVLVETIQTFRHRYMIEVPKGKAEWALDTVTMHEAKEFSQKPLDEIIVSHRVVSKEESIALCDEDNEYTSEWNKELKLNAFYTPWPWNEDGELIETK